MRPFALTLERTASQATLTVRGGVDRAHVDDLEVLFEQACHRHPAIIRVDLSAADSVDSTVSIPSSLSSGPDRVRYRDEHAHA
jgi:ABC-type transporter Mla MlaB component